MDHHTSYRATAVDGRRSSRLRFVLLGALAPVALFALPVGTMMFVGPSGEAASVAGSGPALDCESPRNAWRPACQTARSNLAGNLARDADVTGSISDGPATTAALDQKGKRRSVAGAIASAPADSSAAKPTAEPAAQAASPAQKIVAQASPVTQVSPVAQASPEPARPGPNPPSGREAGAWQEPVRVDPAQESKPPAPLSPASSQPASRQGEPAKAAQDQTVKPESAQAAVPAAADRAARASEETKADSARPKTPVPAPKSAAAAKEEAAPTRSVKSAAPPEVSKPAEETESARRPSRRIARGAPALAAPEKPAPEKPRARVAATRKAEEPVRPARQRVRPVRVEEATEASRPRATASLRRGLRRTAFHRGAPQGGSAVPANLRVSSVQTYFLPDGRRVVVNVPPRAGLVRELAAYHAAAFSGRRTSAAPFWGGGWFGDAPDW